MAEMNGAAGAEVYRLRRPIHGIARPGELRSALSEQRRIIDRYSSIHGHFMTGRSMDALRGMRLLGEAFGQDVLGRVARLGESVRVMLDTIRSESLDSVIKAPWDEEHFAVDMMKAYRSFVPAEAAADAGLSIFERSVELESEVMSLLLSAFLDLRIPLSASDSGRLAAACEGMGNVFLGDELIEDRHRQIISITDPFYFGLFHDRIAAPVLEAVSRLFSEGGHVDAILNCADMWRFAHRSDDPAAKRITRKIGEALLKGLGEPGLRALIEEGGAVGFGVPEEEADSVMKMAKQVLLRQTLAEISDGMRLITGPLRKSPDSAVISLLDVALEGGHVERKEALRKLKQLVASRIRPRRRVFTPTGTYAIETKDDAALANIKTVRKASEVFAEVRYSPIRGELERLELELIGDIVMPLRNDSDAMRTFVKHVFDSPASGDAYLTERIFRVPQLRERNRSVRLQVLGHLERMIGESMASGDLKRLKAFINAEPERIMFHYFFTMLENDANRYVEEENRAKGGVKRALDLYDSLIEGETADSPIYLVSLIMTGKIHLFFGDREKAEKCFAEVIAVEDRDPELAKFRARASYFRGGYLLSVGRFEEARIDLERAAELMPDEPLHLNELGLAYANLDRVDDARAAFKTAMALDASRFMPVHFNASTFYWTIGAYDAAFNIVKNFVANNKKDPKALNDMAIFYSLIDMYIDLVKRGGGGNLQSKIYDVLSSLSRKQKDAFRTVLVAMMKEYGERVVPKRILQLAN